MPGFSFNHSTVARTISASSASPEIASALSAFYERLRARGKTTKAAGGAIARKLAEISYDELLELAGSGAKVMQLRSVEFAKKYGVPFIVKSTFNPHGAGTMVKEIEVKEGKRRTIERRVFPGYILVQMLMNDYTANLIHKNTTIQNYIKEWGAGRQIIEVGWSSIGVSLVLMLLGALLYIPIRRLIKPGVPDVDPFVASEGEE